MKKWLTKEQTDILLSFGFPPVQHCIEVWKDGKVERIVRYTLGDLLELLPKTINNEGIDATLVIYDDGLAYQNDESWEMYEKFQHRELIDNIYECLISLKKNNII